MIIELNAVAATRHRGHQVERRVCVNCPRGKAVDNRTDNWAFGCLVYDDTLATPVVDQGVSYHYFGGSQSVTAGTFTIVWNTSGIYALNL